MRSALAIARSILDAAVTADRRLTIASGLLAVAGWIVVPLQALAIKLFVDSITAREVSGAAVATAATAATMGSLWYFNNLRQFVRLTLHERTVHELDSRVQRLVGDLAGTEHLERPEFLDRLATLRTQSYWFGNVGALFELPALTINVVISAALLVAVDPVLLAVPMAMLPSIVLNGRTERALQHAEQAAASDRRMRVRLFTMATDPAVAGEARLFGAGRELLARHDAADRRVRTVLGGAGMTDIVLSALGWAFFAVALALVFVVVVGGIRNARLGVGDLFLAFYLLRGLTWQAQWALNAIGNLRRTLAATRNYEWLLDYVGTSDHAGRRGELPVPAAGPLRFEGVTFRYPGADADVLTDVSLEVPAGAVLALVGDNGAGKTTLVKLLARFHEPSTGRITMNGRDIGDVAMGAWRRELTACFQDFCRFELLAGETVGVGDLLAPDPSQRVESAVSAAGASDVVLSLPSGLDTPLGASWDGGAELSVGQWQKLALARAMMRPAPRLLLLDEPTAALDAESEARLFERYAAASAFARATGSITIIVSHRMSTVRMADVIAVIDQGVVRQAGSHAALMAADGPYRELYSTQAAAYR